MTTSVPRRIYWSREAEAAARERYRRMLDAWNTPHAEHRVATCQGETFVISAGRSDLPPVVLLPGAMATSAMWLDAIRILSADFHVISVDIIGDAGFSAASRPPMKSEAHAQWLDDVLAGLQVGAASLVGASFGGWLSLDYAIRRTSRVSRLVLLAPAGVGRIRPGFMLRTAPLLFLGAWGHRRALAFDMGLSARQSGPEESAFIDLFDTVRSGFVARMQPIPIFSDRDLRRLDMPMLVVVGALDAVFDSRETQRRIEANAARAEVRMLPDAGHALADTTAMIREFLRRGRLAS